jgi:DNA-directed RNA polymerase specialized sigma24 family protein
MQATANMHGLTDRDILATRTWLIARIRAKGWYPEISHDDLESALDEGLGHGFATFKPGRGANIHTWITRCALQGLRKTLRSDIRHQRLAADRDDGSGNGTQWSDTWQARPEVDEPPWRTMDELLATPRLTARERLALSIRFAEGKKLEAAAKVLRVTRERARQIQKAGLDKIKRHIQGQAYRAGA